MARKRRPTQPGLPRQNAQRNAGLPGRSHAAAQKGRRRAKAGLPRRSANAKAGDDWLFPRVNTEPELAEASLLDVVDSALNHGVVLQGDLVLGVANVDLIYIKLSALVAALDKITHRSARGSGSRRRLPAVSGIDHAISPKHDRQKHTGRQTRPKRSNANRRGSRNAN
jgi:hypothetical protein